MKTFNPIHDINDREEIILTPCQDYPDFYKHPEIHIAASKDGRFYNTRTKKHLIITNDKNNRQRLQFLLGIENGYKHVNIKVHRILARIFIGRPKIHLNKSFDILEVNHIDLNSSNNSLDNLEWCTGIENTNHYFDNGQNTSSKLLFSKNLETGEVLKHRSTAQASKDLNINEGGLQRYIRENRHLKYRYDNYLFSFLENSFIEINQKSLNPPNTDQECIIVDLKFDTKYIFNSIKEGASFINMEYKLLWYHLKTKDKYIKDNFLISRFCDYIEKSILQKNINLRL